MIISMLYPNIFYSISEITVGRLHLNLHAVYEDTRLVGSLLLGEDACVNSYAKLACRWSINVHSSSSSSAR